MPFDEESTQSGNAESLRSEPRGFSPAQMVRCEACLRANPPTRTSCLYCAAHLPVPEAVEGWQRPTLRPLEKWEHGHNVILLPDGTVAAPGEAAQQAAELLRLDAGELRRLVELQVALPIARAASSDEATLVARKLGELGLKALVVADTQLGLDASKASPVRRARALELTEAALVVHPSAGGEASSIPWMEITLLVTGRLFTREIAVEERKGGRAENELVDARETSADESVLDIYTTRSDGVWRIGASGFDFSCLGARKGLVAAQNLMALTAALRERAGGAAHDDSYLRLRGALALAWPLEQHTESRGWRRNAPGRVSTEAVTRSDNETQFTRYSRLRHYLQQNPGSSA